MKIGIMTFHWAANYGAILQAFALQQYLIGLGHNVEVINYKPRKYDFSIIRLMRHPRSGIKVFKSQVYNHRKNRILDKFRLSYLNQTERFISERQLQSISTNYDIIISGSDQILNPSYTLNGEDHPTAAYFLNFCPNIKRIGYSVSFGCDTYPSNAAYYATKWINNFDKISVREITGADVVRSLGYKDAVTLTPDPTILYGRKLICDLPVKKNLTDDRVCIYMLRTVLNVEYKKVIYIDDAHSPLSMSEWLDAVCNSTLLITNSYHGTIMAILYNTPFVVVLDNEKDNPMNNRFYTLLEKLGLLDRICNNDIDKINHISAKLIDWAVINTRIDQFGMIGKEFLKNSI